MSHDEQREALSTLTWTTGQLRDQVQHVIQSVIDGSMPLDRAAVVSKLTGRVCDLTVMEINYHRLLLMRGLKPTKFGAMRLHDPTVIEENECETTPRIGKRS